MPEQHTPQSRVDVERLSRRMGKYALVVAVSQRARQLKDRQAQFGALNQSDLVERALREISDAKVKLIEESEE